MPHGKKHGLYENIRLKRLELLPEVVQKNEEARHTRRAYCTEF